MKTELQNAEMQNRPVNVAEEEELINLMDMLLVVRHNWQWFFVSVVACVALAVLYLAWSPKTYSRKATVLIRDDDKGGGGLGESALFTDISLFGGARNVDNEVLVFQARSLMEKVVDRLSLDYSYKIQKGLRTVELYSHSPLKVAFPDAEAGQYLHVCVTTLQG